MPQRQLDQRIRGVFVSHPKSGFEDREAHIISQFERFGIPFEFIGMFTKDEITPQVRSEFNIGPGLPAGNASNVINHMIAYRKILDNQMPYGLVFEDDVVLTRRFHQVLTATLDEVEQVEGPFCVYLANSMNRYVHWKERRRGQHLYQTNMAKCPDAYLISHDAARLRLDYVAQHGMHQDHGHTYTKLADKAGAIKLFWIAPTIAVPGSTSGRFVTSLERRGRGRSVRKFRWYWKMLFTRMRGVRFAKQ